MKSLNSFLSVIRYLKSIFEKKGTFKLKKAAFSRYCNSKDTQGFTFTPMYYSTSSLLQYINNQGLIICSTLLTVKVIRRRCVINGNMQTTHNLLHNFGKKKDVSKLIIFILN